MTMNAVDGRATWPFEPLYKFLHENLPAWRRADGTLDIPLMAEAIGITAEAVYKWLRKGEIPSGQRVRQLLELARREENLELLGSPPQKDAFFDFCA